MKILIEQHTLIRAVERGTDKAEIIEVLENGFETPAKDGRFSKTMVFDYKNLRNKKYYEQKKIEVIYTIEDNTIVTITVYVYFGKWD